MNHKKESGSTRILSMVYCSLFAVIIALCSFLTVPAVIPFTLQTLGIFLCLELLGGKKGFFSVFIYTLLGAAGLPVFSGFRGGLGILLSNTGGYILGFLVLALVYWFITSLLGTKLPIRILAMFLGLLLCYFFGTFWFVFVYSEQKSLSEVISALQICVIPFLIPDIIKLSCAVGLRKLLRKRLPENLQNNNKKGI